MTYRVIEDKGVDRVGSLVEDKERLFPLNNSTDQKACGRMTGQRLLSLPKNLGATVVEISLHAIGELRCVELYGLSFGAKKAEATLGFQGENSPVRGRCRGLELRRQFDREALIGGLEADVLSPRSRA